MTTSNSEKDWWDKADILGKLLAGVLLALIAVFIKVGTDRIAISQQRGELVRSLITDLTTKDQRTRQDIALIALNHAIGEQDAGLVTEIAERLVVDTTGYSAEDRASSQALGSIAFQILRKRDPARADSVKRFVMARFEETVADSATRAALLPSDTTQGRDSTGTVTDLLARVNSPSVIFMQVGATVPSELVNRLQGRLVRNGFAVPAAQVIQDTGIPSSVRYFYATDREHARRAGEVLNDVLRTFGFEVPPRVQLISGFEGRARRGAMEIWIGRR
jgi:hypothetical protein